jgi:hypothetical protein
MQTFHCFRGAITQSERVLSCLVKVAYFAGVHMDRIEDPDVVQSNPDCGLLP